MAVNRTLSRNRDHVPWAVNPLGNRRCWKALEKPTFREKFAFQCGLLQSGLIKRPMFDA
jgi:hypothetical protein